VYASCNQTKVTQGNCKNPGATKGENGGQV
jgi:hypothetical protein